MAKFSEKLYFVSEQLTEPARQSPKDNFRQQANSLKTLIPATNIFLSLFLPAM